MPGSTCAGGLGRQEGRGVPRAAPRSPSLAAAKGTPQVRPLRTVPLHVPSPSCCPDVQDREVAPGAGRHPGTRWQGPGSQLLCQGRLVAG